MPTIIIDENDAEDEDEEEDDQGTSPR